MVVPKKEDAMSEKTNIDYSVFDRTEILSRLFYPRPELEWIEKPENAHDLLIPVGGDVVVGGRFHMGDKSAPNVLFFHGNGEIVADYDDLGPLFNQVGLNFLAVDYRGYGRSTGTPSVSNMISDCHVVFEFTEKWLAGGGYNGAFVVMGRSLGSTPALELAHEYKDRLDGLIVESGFAHIVPLLALLGINTSTMDLSVDESAGNLSRVCSWDKPALIIHAERDHIIPISEGRALYESCPSPNKTFLMIPSANHNDILMRGMQVYMAAVKKLCEVAGANSVPSI
jgi:fermentation-respiration switch protein FrsA (DUF1100 family)